MRPHSLKGFGLALVLLGWFAAGCGPAPVPLPEGKTPSTRAERIALYREVIGAYLKAGRLPIIDLELMLTPESEIGKILPVMDHEGVALAAVTSRDPALIRRFAERHPERFIPLTPAPHPEEWTHMPVAIYDGIRRRLQEGAFGIGRIPLDLWPGRDDKDKRRERTIQDQKKEFERILRLASGRKVLVWLDMAPEDSGIGWIERRLREHDGATVIWTRAGYLPDSEKLPGYGPGFLRALTLRRPNLFLTLTLRPPARERIFLTHRANLLYDPGGVFSPEWRVMLEARIAHFGTGGSLEASQPKIYRKRMQRFRGRILDALTPDARERLAWRNAWRLLAGSEWTE